MITLIPGQSTLISPLQYQRGRDFSISSVLQLNCDISLSTITRWTIKNCTATSCLSSFSIDRRIITTTSELYIPSKSLNYGTYELQFTVIMSDAPNVTSSSAVYVQITPTGVIANLLQMGTSMITRGSQQDLLLDPGTFSIDLDEDSFDASVSVNDFSENLFDDIFVSNHRNGTTIIIVDCMAHLTFQTSMDYCCQLMILELIQTVHHVSPIDQVNFDCL